MICTTQRVPLRLQTMRYAWDIFHAQSQWQNREWGRGGEAVLRGEACHRWQLLPSLVKSRQAPDSVEPQALGPNAWQEKKGCLLLLLWACSDTQLNWKWAYQLEIQINAAFIHYSLGPRAWDLGSTFSVWLSANAYEPQIKGSGGGRRGVFQLTSPSEGLKMGSYPDKQNKDVKEASRQLGRWRQSSIQTHPMKVMTFGSAGHRDSFGEKNDFKVGRE